MNATRPALALTLLLCAPAAAKADGDAAVPDEALSRTDEPFVISFRSVTGQTFAVRGVLAPGDRRCFRTVTSEGRSLLAAIQLHAASQGTWRVEVKVVEYPRNGPAISHTVSELLTPGGSWVGGRGWNSLFELRLDRK